MRSKKLTVIILFIICVSCCVTLCCCRKECQHLSVSEQAVTLPTCETVGQTNVVCNDCKKVVEVKQVSALGHDWGDFGVTKQPTEQTEGVFSRVCKRDGSHVDSQVIPKLCKDAYLVNVEPSSCTVQGEVTYSHAVFGEFKVKLPLALHTYDDEKEGYCSVCSQKCYSIGLTYELSEDGTYYTVSNKNYGLNEPALVIPHSYKGLPVKAIASEGFAYRPWIKSVVIPEYIETIGSGAFNGTGLTKVWFNAISCNDFKHKNWVFMVDGNVELVVGCRVQRIPDRMFYPLVTQDRTVNLTKITFEDNSVCKTIGNYAFNKTSIKELVLPDSVESIGENAFYNTDITALTLGGGVKTLGSAAFGACKNLKEVTFGAELETISNDCFNYCEDLLSVDLSKTKVSTVGYDAFKGCSSLKTVLLPDTLRTIEKQAFIDCVSLVDLDLGGGLQEIGEQAFENCAELSVLTIPQSVKNIGNAAFSNCRSLNTINFNAEACSDLPSNNRVFYNVATKGKLTVVFGNSVKYVPARLFYATSDVTAIPKIEEVIVSVSTTAIGDYAFFGAEVSKVSYGGTAEQWQSVSKGVGNDTFVSAVK